MQLYISKNKMQQSKERRGEGERWTGSRKREMEHDGKHISGKNYKLQWIIKTFQIKHCLSMEKASDNLTQLRQFQTNNGECNKNMSREKS